MAANGASIAFNENKHPLNGFRTKYNIYVTQRINLDPMDKKFKASKAFGQK
ncbi:MAG: hypothetical protein ACM3UZ_12525 [Acidobacteriota bacterium]